MNKTTLRMAALALVLMLAAWLGISNSGRDGEGGSAAQSSFAEPRQGVTILELPSHRGSPNDSSRPLESSSDSGSRDPESRASPASLPDRVRELELSARSDPNALAHLASFRSACQYWLQDQQREASSERSRQPEWGSALGAVCSEGTLARFEETLSTVSSNAMEEVMIQPWHHDPATAEEFEKRDAQLEDQMQLAGSAAAAFNAAIVYFDHERFAQWAGSLRPRHLHDERSFLRSRIGLDVAWMYACRLGFDCGPYAGLTLLECWETPGCVPGGAARQVVQMRRSPLELRLVDSMVDRLMAERVAAQR